MAELGSISGQQRQTQGAYQGIFQGGGAVPRGTQWNPFNRPGEGGPGDWWRGSRQGQFGFPQPGQLPPNIGEIRGLMQKYQNQPTDWQTEFNRMNPGFSQQWQGVFNMPGEAGRGEDPNAPYDFNVGPRLASAPLGEMAGPSAPWAGWQPAQEEA